MSHKKEIQATESESTSPQDPNQNTSSGSSHVSSSASRSSKASQSEPSSSSLVEILDEGHYVRYDFSTATKLLDVAGAIKEEYGTFGEMLKRFRSVEELEMRLQEFRGVGPKTVEIFMRDMKPLLE
ncbi:hypothetical protein RU639_005482 [Aspergillus parasiticus]